MKGGKGLSEVAGARQSLHVDLAGVSAADLADSLQQIVERYVTGRFGPATAEACIADLPSPAFISMSMRMCISGTVKIEF